MLNKNTRHMRTQFPYVHYECDFEAGVLMYLNIDIGHTKLSFLHEHFECGSLNLFFSWLKTGIAHMKMFSAHSCEHSLYEFSNFSLIRCKRCIAHMKFFSAHSREHSLYAVSNISLIRCKSRTWKQLPHEQLECVFLICFFVVLNKNTRHTLCRNLFFWEFSCGCDFHEFSPC